MYDTNKPAACWLPVGTLHCATSSGDWTGWSRLTSRQETTQQTMLLWDRWGQGGRGTPLWQGTREQVEPRCISLQQAA